MWVEGRSWKGDAGGVKGGGPVGGRMVVVGHSGNYLPLMFIKLSAQWTENGFTAG